MFNRDGFYGVKGVLFDCYNTLIDIKTNERDIKSYEPVSKWLKYHGVNISPQDLMNEYRWRCKDELERRGEWHSELKVEEIFSRICRERASWPINDATVGIEAARLFRAASIRRLRPFPQSVQLLQKLRGYPLGIVSNGQRVFSELELRQLGLHGYFNFVLFSSDFGYKKPDSRIFLAGAGHLGMSPQNILYIGDSWDNDIHPSRGLGMKAMHIEEAWRHFA
ncbi:MAG: HAD family hydrolase [Methanotrichaceae archaeon]|nr:HAD family hydrolase [Methanotrichaceae archaeon]